MTSLRFRPLLALFAVAALGACERHEWEDTKVLFKGHGEDHSDHGKGHDSHGEEKPHAEPAKH